MNLRGYLGLRVLVGLRVSSKFFHLRLQAITSELHELLVVRALEPPELNWPDLKTPKNQCSRLRYFKPLLCKIIKS